MKRSHQFPMISLLYVFCLLNVAVVASPSDFLSRPEPEFFLVNNTSYKVNDVVRWTSDYLGIKDVTVCLSYQVGSYEEDAFVVKEKDIYLIYVKKKLKNIDLILVHELIHVKQYESEKLVKINPTTMKYEGKLIDLNWLDYRSRPYEREAHIMDYKILKAFIRYKKKGKKEEMKMSCRK